VDGSWDGNERENVSCEKYNKTIMAVDIEDEFRGWRPWKIEIYWYWMKEYVL
jgi:hypothetical protein